MGDTERTPDPKHPYATQPLCQELLMQGGETDQAWLHLTQLKGLSDIELISSSAPKFLLQAGLPSKTAQDSNFHDGLYLVSANWTGPGQQSWSLRSLLGHPWHEGVGEELPSLTVTKLLFSSLMMSPTSTLSHKSSFRLEENPSYKSTREKGIP